MSTYIKKLPVFSFFRVAASAKYLGACALVWTSFGAMAGPASVVELWTARRHSYDVHAVEKDRFVIEHSARFASGKVARFTVKPGDSFLGSSGERSEVVLGGWEARSRFRVLGSEGHEFFRVSVKLAPGWVAPQTNKSGYAWGTFFQLHGPNQYTGTSPAISFNVGDEFELFVLTGDLSKRAVFKKLPLNTGLNVGRWVDFILEVEWAWDANGAISIYRREEGSDTWEKVLDVKYIATLQYRDTPIPNSHYWKSGFYRSESEYANSLWLGPILRGRTFAEVSIN